MDNTYLHNPENLETFYWKSIFIADIASNSFDIKVYDNELHSKLKKKMNCWFIAECEIQNEKLEVNFYFEYDAFKRDEDFEIETENLAIEIAEEVFYELN